MDKVLIVGGTGFIGSHLVQEAAARGYDVTVISLRKRNFSIQSQLVKSASIVNIDNTKKDELKATFQGDKFNYVINCSGYIDHTLFKDGGRKIIDQHLTTVMNLAESLDRTELKSFIQIGSSDEYGNSAAPQSEDYRESPISPYSFGKTAATHFLQMLCKTEGYPATIIRLFLTYGPGQDGHRFLPQVIGGCLRDATFPVSAGGQVRDFCFVKDIVNGIFSVFGNSECRGEIINLASGVGIKIRTIIEMVRDIVCSGNPDYGKIAYRKNENMFLCADVSKARSLLEWQPQTTIEDGLKETIKFYKAMKR